MSMKQGLEEKLEALVSSRSAAVARDEWTNAQPSAFAPLFDYRFDHVSQVVRISKFLASQTGANPDIVTMAAWLHDLSKPGIGGDSNHGENSAAAAREILLKEGIDKPTVDRVCDAIRKHVGLTLEGPLATSEAQVLWEADKIVKLGILGLVHYILNGIKLRPGMDIEGIATEIRGFIPLAERIAASMKTPPAKQIANSRLQHLKTVSSFLDSELATPTSAARPAIKKAEATTQLRAGILTIGNEILNGVVLDSNSNWMELRLVALGVSMERQISVRDDTSDIGKALAHLRETCNVIITSGGLGPTHDDMTLNAIARALALQLQEDSAALSIVERQYQHLYEQGIVGSPDLTESRRKMASLPAGSKPLDNTVGGAPGVIIVLEGVTIFCLPGVPRELKVMFESSIRPWIEKRSSQRYFERIVDFEVSDETVFAPFIERVMRKHPGVYIKSMPKTYGSSKVLRVWVSARGDNSGVLKTSVENAISALSQESGFKVSIPSASQDDSR